MILRYFINLNIIRKIPYGAVSKMCLSGFKIYQQIKNISAVLKFIKTNFEQRKNGKSKRVRCDELQYRSSRSLEVLRTKVSYSLKTKFSTAEDASNYTTVLEKFEEYFKPTKM